MHYSYATHCESRVAVTTGGGRAALGLDGRGRPSLHEHSIRSKSSVRNSVLPGLPCQAGDGEFLQISSDGFRLALWTFPGVRRKIELTCGICSPLLSEPGEPSRWGVRQTGRFPNPSNTIKGFGHVTQVTSEQANHKIRKFPPAYPAPRPFSRSPTASRKAESTFHNS